MVTRGSPKPLLRVRILLPLRNAKALQIQHLQGSFVHPCSSHSRLLGVYLFIHPALHMKEMSGGRISPAILAVLLDN